MQQLQLHRCLCDCNRIVHEAVGQGSPTAGIEESEEGNMRKRYIDKIMAACICCGTLVFGSLNVCAAPETMPDGTVFDADYYAKQYPDVVAAVGNDPAALYHHYCACGRAEGRQAYAVKVYADDIHIADTTTKEYDEYQKNNGWFSLENPLEIAIPDDLDDSQLFAYLMTTLGYVQTENGEFVPPEIDIYSVLGISPSASEVDKVVAAHTYICREHSYGQHGRDIHGVLDNRYVCADYARDFYECMRLMGVEADIIEGFAGGGSHAWNRVLIGEKYYYVDVCWDDGYAGVIDNPWEAKYFMISSEKMAQTHTTCRIYKQEPTIFK